MSRQKWKQIIRLKRKEENPSAKAEASLTGRVAGKTDWCSLVPLSGGIFPPASPLRHLLRCLRPPSGKAT